VTHEVARQLAVFRGGSADAAKAAPTNGPHPLRRLHPQSARSLSWRKVLAPPSVRALTPIEIGILFLGATLALMFWMIPRSIDETQISFAMNGLYVYSLLTVGFLLSHFWPLLPGVVKVAYALYASSMIVGLGLLYASLSTLLCSAFTLEDQHAFGWMIVPVGLPLYALALLFATRWLKTPVAG
jgi:hypothetical protein